jgi:hypothetical protein
MLNPDLDLRFLGPLFIHLIQLGHGRFVLFSTLIWDPTTDRTDHWLSPLARALTSGSCKYRHLSILMCTHHEALHSSSASPHLMAVIAAVMPDLINVSSSEYYPPPSPSHPYASSQLVALHPDIEPDPAWKGALRKQIEDSLSSMVDDAKRNSDDGLQKGFVDERSRIELSHQYDAMSAIRVFAQREFKSALDKERRLRL